jgi:hypothetical protein
MTDTIPIPQDTMRMRGRDVLACGSDDPELVVVSMPDGMTTRTCWTLIDLALVDEGLDLERDERGLFWTSPEGRIDFDATLPEIRSPDTAAWRSLTVLDHERDAVRVDLDGGPGLMTIGGVFGVGRREIEETVRRLHPVGSVMDVREGEMGGISRMRHPAPTIDALTVALLEHMGVDMAALAVLIAPKCHTLGGESGVVALEGPLRLLEIGRTDVERMHFETNDGHVTCQIAFGGLQFSGTALDIRQRLPQTVAEALMGRPLSSLVALPFDHHDPLVVEASPVGDFVYARIEARPAALAPSRKEKP